MARTYAVLVRQALAKLDAGSTVSASEAQALASYQRRSGSATPLQSLAPRTRRRYLSAVDRGQTAAQANKAERLKYRARTASRLARIDRMRQQIIDSGLNDHEHDKESMDEFIDIYGPEQIERRLEAQLEDIERYKNGDRNFGRKPSDTIGDMHPLRGETMDYATALYYYRVSLK